MIKVIDKDNKQYILNKDGSWEKVNNFKKGDIFEYIKEHSTSEGVIKVGDTFIIDQVWDSVYWIRCLNRKRDGSHGRKGEEWIMGTSLMDFNDEINILFINQNKDD
jgi:hypothetical protein